MLVGVLGEILFEVSENQILTPDNIQWSGAARYGVHDRHLNNALTEFTGRDPDTISFDIYLSAALGVNPMRTIWKLFDYERSGIALALTIGDHGYGRYLWNIINHTTKIQHTDGAGNIISATITLNLQEYLKD